MEMRSTSNEYLAFDSNLEKKCCKLDGKLWKLTAIVSIVISLIAILIGVVAMNKVNLPPSSSSMQSTQENIFINIPSSCEEINGPSGLYKIQPERRAQPFEVYCEMDIDGGGWTLVASIHENNIDGKCTPGDKWSSEQGIHSDKGSENWENSNVFGQLEAITDDDYKNPAYYSLPASNIMLWHVPNRKKWFEMSDAATLKYFTDNNFLNRTTLRNLFAEQVPLKIAERGLYSLIRFINESESSITRGISKWYDYIYDALNMESVISDGGSDMYDGGNIIYFGTDRENFTRLNYNTPYFLYGSGVEILSSTSHPFIMFAWIGSGLGRVQSNIEYFDIRVASNFGADGKGESATYGTKKVNQGNMSATYTAFNIANTSDPSICEVYFSISSSQWNSKSPTFERIRWSNNTGIADNQVRFGGRPSNVLVGYTLLSKFYGNTVTVEEVEYVLQKYMSLAENFVVNVSVPHQVVPIKYAKGSNATVLAGIPTAHKETVEPGFIQFRAFNSVGLPNALCPGVKVNCDSPEQICVGGSSTAFRDITQCGDFAGWRGAPGDRGYQTFPSATGRSQNDINSSILIFTR